MASVVCPCVRDHSQAVTGLGQIGLRFQGRLVMGYGFGVPPSGHQDRCQTGMGFGPIGLHFQRLLIMGDRFVNCPRRAKARAITKWSVADDLVCTGCSNERADEALPPAVAAAARLAAVDGHDRVQAVFQEGQFGRQSAEILQQLADGTG